MKNIEVAKAFAKGMSGESLNMRTDGKKVWSYGTVIAQRLANGKVIMNMTRYSNSTSHHQAYVRYEVGEYTPTTKTVPMWTTDLKKYR